MKPGPLLISDCDDVLLHFAPHFAEWVAEAHGLVFNLDAPNFGGALRDADGEPVARERVWPLLDHFFDREMHRQHLVPGAFEALQRIGEEADIVILTNIGDQHHANRIAQLEAFDIRHRVLCNQGGKGPPVAELIAEMAPERGGLRRRSLPSSRIGGEPRARRLAAAHDRRAAARRDQPAGAFRPCPDRRVGRGPAVDSREARLTETLDRSCFFELWLLPIGRRHGWSGRSRGSIMKRLP